jgi:hypothetical protein
MIIGYLESLSLFHTTVSVLKECCSRMMQFKSEDLYGHRARMIAQEQHGRYDISQARTPFTTAQFEDIVKPLVGAVLPN